VKEQLDPAALAAATARRLGDGTTIDRLQRFSGGASRELWGYDATPPGGTTVGLVLRRDPAGSGAAGGIAQGVDEYRLLQAAEAAGVPVAPLRFRLDPDDGLGSGFVMDRIDGETLGRRIVRDDGYAAARVALPAQFGEALARIHATPVDASGLAVSRHDEHPALRQVREFEQLVDGFGVTRPVLELALRWLRLNAPPSTRRVVVHGDFRMGNLIVGPEGLRAVLDWELAHVGDPGEDVGWLCVRSWRFGGRGRVGGVGELDDLLQAYRDAGGELDAEHVRYWEVFGNLRWGVICLMQAFTHLNGTRRSVELAAIGRRVCEVEHDLMELLS
jgi:aminoglycoside phosphotransferase (APT) family kinase protein